MRGGSADPEKREMFSRRAFMFTSGLGALFLGVSARLYHLQITAHEDFEALALENQFNKRVITPLRGEIVDRFGKSLASNRQNFRILLVPDETPDIARTLEEISNHVPLSPQRIDRILREIRRTGGVNPVQVTDNLDWDEFAKVSFERPNLPGALPEVGETRNYPLGSATAFVIGYVGAVTDRDLRAQETEEARVLLRQPGFKVGRDGLERTYERELRGIAGEMQVRVNAHGRVLEKFEDKALPSTQGETLGLTIDGELQAAAMKELEGESASAVVIDVETGDILVLRPHRPLIQICLIPAFPPSCGEI